MSSILDAWKNFWAITGPISLISLMVLLLYLYNPEKFERIAIHINWLLSKVSKRREKKAIAKEIRYIILTKFKENFGLEEVPEIVVEWGDEERAVRDIRRGRLVIVLKAGKYRYENLARALIVSIPELLAPELRAVLDERFVECLSAHVARNLASDHPQVVAAINQVIRSLVEEDEHFKQLASKLVEIDDRSLLSRILIPMLIRVARARYPQRDPALDREVEELVTMLSKLSRGEEVESPVIYGKYIKVAFVRVAKPEKVEALLEPHVIFVRKMLEKYKDLETLYVLAAGRYVAAGKFCMKRLRTELKAQGWKVSCREYVYEGRYRDIPQKMKLYVGELELMRRRSH